MFRGKVFVFSGILPICKNEDGLAAVLGHEIAHNVAHHVQEKASLPYLITLAVGLVTIFFDNSADFTRFILNYGLDLPNSRAQEVSRSCNYLWDPSSQLTRACQREADYLGLRMLRPRNQEVAVPA